MCVYISDVNRSIVPKKTTETWFIVQNGAQILASFNFISLRSSDFSLRFHPKKLLRSDESPMNWNTHKERSHHTGNTGSLTWCGWHDDMSGCQIDFDIGPGLRQIPHFHIDRSQCEGGGGFWKWGGSSNQQQSKWHCTLCVHYFP